MLPSPVDVVVGASDMEAATRFLIHFGFEMGVAGTLPAEAARALYGIDAPVDELVMAAPGAPRGRVRLVSTPNPARTYAPFDARPFAIDLFTADMDRSVAEARKAGYHTSPVTDHRFGPVTIREVEIIGPDRVVMTLLEPSAGRRPCILDDDPGRLHSEVHAFVWSDTDLDRHIGYWTDRGLQTLMDVVMETPGLGALVGAPDEDVKLRLTVFADQPEARPIRVEYVEFIGKPSQPQPTLPLAAGLHAPAFELEDLDAVLEELAPAEIGEVVAVDTPVHPGMRAATAVTPGGHRFEVWGKAESS
ncbi:MAG: VOC family protein [Candidatus Sulfomarinibacteraceae bacterium]